MEDSGRSGGSTGRRPRTSPGSPRETLERSWKPLRRRRRPVSYRRRILQGRIDLIRAELVGRGVAALAPEDLARVLLGNFPEDER